MNRFYDTTESRPVAAEFSLTKVFMWLFIAMGITAITGWGFGELLLLGYLTYDQYSIITIVASILMLVETFVMHFRVMKNNKSLVIPYIIYAVSMGFLMSSIFVLVNSYYIFIAFGITAGLFGVMALYGYFTKTNLIPMAAIASTAFFGAIILGLINFFIGSSTVDWIVSFVTFGAIMLFTAVDMWRIRKIAESGFGSSNICLYCAFQLYVDFMYIFLRVLSFISRYTNNN